MISRNLGKCFIGLLMSTNLGIYVEWLYDTSRLDDADGNYDYSQFIVDHPSLKNCCKF